MVPSVPLYPTGGHLWTLSTTCEAASEDARPRVCAGSSAQARPPPLAIREARGPLSSHQTGERAPWKSLTRPGQRPWVALCLPETSKSKSGVRKGRREGEKAGSRGQAMKAPAGDSEDVGRSQRVLRVTWQNLACFPTDSL